MQESKKKSAEELKEKVNVGVHIQVVTSYKLIKEQEVNIEVENERLVEKNQNQGDTINSNYDVSNSKSHYFKLYLKIQPNIFMPANIVPFMVPETFEMPILRL